MPAAIRAAVFDAYGTLLDVNAAAAGARDALGPRWQPLAELWRARQLQYTWLRGLAGRHADFRRVTADALDFALEALAIPADAALRERLLAIYDRLPAYPDARPALEALRAAGLRCAILSNGTPAMLDGAVRAGGLEAHLEAVLSVEAVGVYKPHPSVYRLACDALGLAPGELLFVSANGWDAWGAKVSGLRVAWCNRAGAPRERLGADPDHEIASLAALPALVAGTR